MHFILEGIIDRVLLGSWFGFVSGNTTEVLRAFSRVLETSYGIVTSDCRGRLHHCFLIVLNQQTTSHRFCLEVTDRNTIMSAVLILGNSRHGQGFNIHNYPISIIILIYSSK